MYCTFWRKRRLTLTLNLTPSLTLNVTLIYTLTMTRTQTLSSQGNQSLFININNQYNFKYFKHAKLGLKLIPFRDVQRHLKLSGYNILVPG